tara:strand:- start:562 stop:1062 length:501 start_codon:yes stop_codon:yes gene_type:complete
MTTNLKSSWTFWYHENDTKDWSRNSYKKIQNVNTAEEFWGIYKLFTEETITNGMFFIMKDDIFPDWKSGKNRNGGFWSVKIDYRYMLEKDTNIIKILKEWVLHLIDESLIENDDRICVHGISISPKNTHCVLKVWMGDKTLVSSLTNLYVELPCLNTCKFTAFSNK